MIDYDLNENQINKFNKYADLLVEWNEKMNLTAITDRDEIDLKHFTDSLSVAKFVEKGGKAIDVGTGAGFPGIPLKIYDETLNLTLLDSLQKRLIFLNEVVNELDLKKVEIVHGRAEDFGKETKYREQYDVAVSRAVAKLSTLIEYLMPFVKVGGRCICMKGPNVEDELKEADFAIKELGGEIEKIENFVLPDSDIERNIIVIKKISHTKSKYPRKAGIPGKEPIIGNFK